jgi:integrase
MGEPRPDYENAVESLKSDESVDEADAAHIVEMCAAFDEEDARASLPRDIYQSRTTSHNKPTTLEGWVIHLHKVAKEITLTTADADEINELTTEWVKADGPPRKGYIRNVEHSLSKFYRFHDDLGINPLDIVKHDYDGDGDEWDARDLLEPEERKALRTAADHPRDLAIYHLAIYTGVRNTALRTLRVRDIDLDAGEFYFNTTADGLKDIHRPTEPRPLNQAFRAVKDWLDMHPTANPDDYLITQKPEWSRADPSTPVSRETIRRTLKELKQTTVERADIATVEKPVHPHMMRHNFVSMCRKHPDITDGDIKFWLGHAENSAIMETTYSHLTADDHNESAHTSFGALNAGDGDDDVDPWDVTCNRCQRVLAPAQDECDACGTDRGETPWELEDRDRLVEVFTDLVAEKWGPSFNRLFEEALHADTDEEKVNIITNKPDFTEMSADDIKEDGISLDDL